MAGTPAIFVRLSGCNVRCNFCDSEYTRKRTLTTPAELLDQVDRLDNDGLIRLVVFTGGEPLRQNLDPAIKALYREGYHIQVETNGTLPPGKDTALRIRNGHYRWDEVSFICSPKAPAINLEIEQAALAFKYVLEADYVDPMDGLPTRVLGSMRPGRPLLPGRKIYIQPCDEQDETKNKANTLAALNSCMEHGYILSLQTHKLLGLE